MIICINVEKAFEKIQYPFIIQTNKRNLSRLGTEGNFLNLIKNVYRIPTSNFILNRN